MVLPEKVETGIDGLITESTIELDCNLKAVFMFGSGNNSDFVPGLSDLDFIYLLKRIDTTNLAKIRELRQLGVQYTGCKVDIKPFTVTEFNASVRNVGSFEFFTGWGLEMIRRGYQKCLYNSGEISLDYMVGRERLKEDALERAHYYITKLRKLYSSDDALLLRGSRITPDETEYLKLVTSSVKNILSFCLAYKGILVDDGASAVEKGEHEFGAMPEVRILFDNKKRKIFSASVLSQAYDRIEEIYSNMLENEKRDNRNLQSRIVQRGNSNE
jgi:hypothetical protein